jgi:tripartite ATP-independent transporter DctP family solute receptor
MAAAVFAMATLAQAQPLTLTIASAINAEHTTGRAIGRIKAEVARRTNGAIDIEISDREKLGSATALVQKVRAGAIFGTWVAATFVARLVPEVDVVNLPFVFRNYRDAERTVDGRVGKLIESKLDAKGFTTLAWMELGARTVMNAKRPLREIGDFNGLRMRVQPGEIYTATFRALGTTPIVVDTRDNYMALQNGDIDSMDVPCSIVDAFKYYEHLKYISDTNHILDFAILIVNKGEFLRLTREQQKAFRDASKAATLWQRKMGNDGEAAALADLKAKGLQFDPIPPATRVALRKATAVVIGRMRNLLGANLVDRVVAESSRPNDGRE